MKANITQKGCLEIAPENGLEAYALNMWCENNFVEDRGDGKTLLRTEGIVVRTSFQDPFEEDK